MSVKLKPINLHISAKLIREATKGDARKCAIAQALVNSDPDIVWANVTPSFIRIGRRSDEMEYKYHTPVRAVRFLTDFDNDRSPQPFHLRLAIGDFVSMRKRQMRQRETREQRFRTVKTAQSKGVSPKDIDPSEVEVFDAEGTAYVPPPVKRKVRRAGDPVRPYAKRQTIAEAFRQK